MTKPVIDQDSHIPPVTSGVVLNDTSLKEIVDAGNLLSDSGILLEKQIWGIKAESYRQLAEIARKYLRAIESNGVHGDIEALAKELHEAGGRSVVLAKLWDSTVQVRNRGVKYGDLNTGGPVWDALSKVFAEWPGREAADAGWKADKTAK